MKKIFTASTLKMIAISTMVIDHISWGFFDFYSWQGYLLHIIGRFTIPIMCFFLAEGYRKTSNLRRYLLRMGFFALVTVVPFYLFFHEEYDYRQNIIFDYLLALLLLTVIDSKKLNRFVKVLLGTLLVLTSMFIGGWPLLPMAYVLIFYYGKTVKQQAIWFCSVTVGLVVLLGGTIFLNTLFHFYPRYNSWVWWDKSYFLGFMLALPLLFRYNGKKGDCPFGRYFFFLFYPCHFLVLYGIKIFTGLYGNYWIYVGLQVLCILLMLGFAIRVMLEKSSKAQNACVLLSVGTIVYAVAFFIETTAKTLDRAYGAVTMEYLGEAAAFIGMTIFLSEFAHFYMSRLFYLIEGILCGITVVLVFTAEQNHIFYTEIRMDYSGAFPRLILNYGIGFYVFTILLTTLFIVYICKLIAAFKKGSPIERKRISLLITGLFFPWLAILVRVLGFTDGYEVSFLGLIISFLFMIIALLRYGYFNSVQHAITNVIHGSNDGLLVFSNNRDVLYFNNIVKKIFPAIGEKRSTSKDVLLSDTIDKFFDESGVLLENPPQNTIEISDTVYEITLEPILESGYSQGYMMRIFDYTHHYRKMEILRKSAHLDSLTGLYDRELFKQKITEHISKGGTGALFMADIDFFKSINDKHGHIAGDEVLIVLANALRSVFSDGHFYCRAGGDEFMMFVKDIEDTTQLEHYAETLNSVYKENVKDAIEGDFSSLSVGIVKTASIKENTKSTDIFEKLYALADKALYVTKKNGKNGHSFYST